MRLGTGLSFSWRRASGISAFKGRISRATGVPLTESGRERKVGRAVMRGGGLLIWVLIALAFSQCKGPSARADAALTGRDCGWLVISMGEVDRAADLCPDDAEFFTQKADWFNTVAGNRCGQFDRAALAEAYVTGSELINKWTKKTSTEDMCARLRATIEEETK